MVKRRIILWLFVCTWVLQTCYDLPPLPDRPDFNQICSGVSCYEPPPNRSCVSGNEISVPAAVGWCSMGQCEYAAIMETCSIGLCSDGLCEESPCQGVTCNLPPEPKCKDYNTLEVSNNIGYCSSGYMSYECKYATKEVVCENSCEEGECKGNSCVGVTCNKPPARFCNGNTLVVFDMLGRCAASGECNYQQQQVDCGAGGCENGACNDNICAEITCNTKPASYCFNSSTLRTFKSSGNCSSGVCLYEHTDIECNEGCFNGQCTNEPCAGVTCESFPASYCKDSKTLVHWDGSPGACFGDGACEYQLTQQECPGNCVGGACEGAPCTGVICMTPPAATCDGNFIIEYITPGFCTGDGHCQYNQVLPPTKYCGSGSDADADVDSDADADVDSDADTVCDEQEFPIEYVPSKFMILLQSTGSMSPYWNIVVDGINNAYNGLNIMHDVGFDSYPNDSACGVGDGVWVDAQPDSSQAIENALGNLTQDGNNAMYCALNNFTSPGYSMNLEMYDGTIVLITSSADSCGTTCLTGNSADASQFSDLAGQLLTAGIKTMGIFVGSGEGQDLLDAIAVNGGTGSTQALNANDSTQLTNALEGIGQNVEKCEYSFDEPTVTLDSDNVNFYFDDEIVYKIDDCFMGSGWSWTDGSRTSVEFCLTACQQITNGDILDIAGKYGCPTKIQ